MLLINKVKDVIIMGTAIKISTEFAEKAKINAKISRRSMAGQVEYWAFIGKIVENNQDLSF
jgi:hypothetical protein